MCSVEQIANAKVWKGARVWCVQGLARRMSEEERESSRRSEISATTNYIGSGLIFSFEKITLAILW